MPDWILEQGVLRLAAATACVFVFLAAFEIALHGFALRDVYAGISALRDHDSAARYFPLALAGYAALAATIVLVTASLRAEGPFDAIVPALLIGLGIAVASALSQGAAYRVPLHLIPVWVLAGTIQFTAGAVVARIVLKTMGEGLA